MAGLPHWMAAAQCNVCNSLKPRPSWRWVWVGDCIGNYKALLFPVKAIPLFQHCSFIFHVSQCSLKSQYNYIMQHLEAPYNRKCRWSLRLVVWPKTGCKNILEDFKFGSGGTISILCVVQLWSQHVKLVEHRWAAALTVRVRITMKSYKVELY